MDISGAAQNVGIQKWSPKNLPIRYEYMEKNPIVYMNYSHGEKS